MENIKQINTLRTKTSTKTIACRKKCSKKNTACIIKECQKVDTKLWILNWKYNKLQTELKVNTACGASNLSFGLPNRGGLNAAFIAMAISSGMPCAITNPLEKEIMQSIRGANTIMGNDPECSEWIKNYRDPSEQRSKRKRRRR